MIFKIGDRVKDTDGMLGTIVDVPPMPGVGWPSVQNDLGIAYRINPKNLVLVSSISPGLSMGIDPNDLQFDLESKSTGVHKCHCLMEVIWRDGCKCSGI